MKILTSAKYQFSRSKKALVIFYSILLGVVVLIGLLNHFFSQGDVQSSNSIEMSSMIFIFVTGLNSFKSEFNFSLANGVSRKSLFIASIINLFSVATLMTFIDVALGAILSKVSIYTSLFNGIYSERYGTLSYTVGNVLEGFLWSVVMYTLVACIGYFITTLYYRLSKPLKLVVSIGVPIFVLIGIPIIDELTKGRLNLSRNILTFIAKALGVFNGASNPIMAVFSGICSITIVGALTFLLMKRATIKE